MLAVNSPVTDAIVSGLSGAQADIFAAGVAAVGISVALLGGRKAWGYFTKLFKA